MPHVLHCKTDIGGAERNVFLPVDMLDMRCCEDGIHDPLQHLQHNGNKKGQMKQPGVQTKMA